MITFSFLRMMHQKTIYKNCNIKVLQFNLHKTLWWLKLTAICVKLTMLKVVWVFFSDFWQTGIISLKQCINFSNDNQDLSRIPVFSENDSFPELHRKTIPIVNPWPFLSFHHTSVLIPLSAFGCLCHGMLTQRLDLLAPISAWYRGKALNGTCAHLDLHSRLFFSWDHSHTSLNVWWHFCSSFPERGFQSAHSPETGPARAAVCKPRRVSPGVSHTGLLRIYSLWDQINFQEGFELGSSITGGLSHRVINQGKCIYFNNQIHHITLMIFFFLLRCCRHRYQTLDRGGLTCKGKCPIAHVKWTRFHQPVFIMKGSPLGTKSNFKNLPTKASGKVRSRMNVICLSVVKASS